MPGLVDSHAHLAADVLETVGGEPEAIRRRAFACVENGTFLVADKGWGDTTVIATLPGLPADRCPDWEAAGRLISSPGGYFPGFGVETDAAGLAGVVAEAVAEGQGWVKLIGDWPRRGLGAVANFDEDALAGAVAIAHRGGAKVAIHSMAPDVPGMAVRAGVDSIEHGLFLTGDDLAALAARGGAWVPTILRVEATIAMLGRDSSGGRLLSEGLDNVRSLLPSVPDGLFVLAGTDLVVPSGRVGQEVVALVEAGLAPAAALAGAGSAARRYLGRADGFELGQPADAVFYAADPLSDPSTLLAPQAVIRAGTRLR